MNLEHLDTVISFVAIITGVSLLVTTLTQMASALFGLRGADLRWGIATLLKHADPNLAEHAKTIAQEVLTHSIISDSVLTDWKTAQYWQLATAIRKDELIRTLRTLAQQAATSDGGQQAAPWAIALKKSLDQLDRAAADKLLQLSPAIKQAIPPEVANADDIISQLAGSAEQLTSTINQCFDAMMDRVSQQFTMHARIFTVLFSVLIAFALHLATTLVGHQLAAPDRNCLIAEYY